MIRRVVPYGVALVAVGVVGAALGLAAWALRLPRIETFLLVFVLLAGAIAWRLGRGPAIAATVAFALVSDYFFIEPQRGFGTETVGDTVRLVTGLLAAAAVIQFVHVPVAIRSCWRSAKTYCRMCRRASSRASTPTRSSTRWRKRRCGSSTTSISASTTGTRPPSDWCSQSRSPALIPTGGSTGIP